MAAVKRDDEVRSLLNRLHGEGGRGWIERAAERLTIHFDRLWAAEADRDRYRDENSRLRLWIRLAAGDEADRVLAALSEAGMGPMTSGPETDGE